MGPEIVVCESFEATLKELEKLRQELYDTYNYFGLTSNLVLLKSQELDQLLDHYNLLQTR